MQITFQKTVLNEVHRNLGANMVNYEGWNMPLSYTNQIEEHHAVRNMAGIFDASHMGEILISGKDASVLIQKLFSRDIRNMKNGQIYLGVLCNEQGGIIDDLTVYKYNNERYILVVNAEKCKNDYYWIARHAGGLKIKISNISDLISKIDVQGPNSERILQKLTEIDVSKLKKCHFENGAVNEIEMTISRLGYTGEDGFELYLPNDSAEQVWRKLLEVGRPDGLIPCGMGARSTLRTENGLMRYGYDIDEDITPLESVYEWAVSFKKDFIGKIALIRQKEAGLERKLIGFEMSEKAVAREGYEIYNDGKQVGEVSTGIHSPTSGKSIGIGYVFYGFHEPGTEIDIKVRNNLVKAKIVKLPFYKRPN